MSAPFYSEYVQLFICFVSFFRDFNDLFFNIKEFLYELILNLLISADYGILYLLVCSHNRVFNLLICTDYGVLDLCLLWFKCCDDYLF